MHFQKLPDSLLKIPSGNEQKKQVLRINRTENHLAIVEPSYYTNSIR